MPVYYNNLCYTYIEADGTRHELNSGVATGSPTVFTSYDSTYLKFDVSTKKLYMMNGTCITFNDTSTNDFQYAPIEIKDLNGNKITITNLSSNCSYCGIRCCCSIWYWEVGTCCCQAGLVLILMKKHKKVKQN